MKTLPHFAIAGLTVISELGCAHKRTPVRYEVPSPYVGWVGVEFGSTGSPALPIRNGYLLARFPDTPRLRTSTDFVDGVAPDVFVDGDNVLPPYSAGAPCGRCVHDIRVVGSRPGQKQGIVVVFFVGSTAEHRLALPTFENFVDEFDREGKPMN